MRSTLLELLIVGCAAIAASPAAACGDDAAHAGATAAPTSAEPPGSTVAPASTATPASTVATASALPPHANYSDLAAALIATIPANARVVGFGELHQRTDRAAQPSTLASFTQALPAIADRLSDLVVETWLVDPACGQAAVEVTARVETAMKRPAATKSEIGELADTARAAHVLPLAMQLNCADYAAIGEHSEPDPAMLLTLTTRELTRITTGAIAHRDREPTHRPWIAVYGGALHNDRFPDSSVAEWSYAAAVDRASAGHFVEIDLISPLLAEADPASRRQPWFSLVGAARDPARPVAVWTRGERSFVVVLP